MAISVGILRNRRTVRIGYVGGAFVAATLVIATLLSSHASALSISDIPLVGRSVAGATNTAVNGVVAPTVNAVANILPAPVGSAVKAPVQAVTQTVTPLIGQSTPAAAPQNTTTAQQQSAANSNNTQTSPTTPVVQKTNQQPNTSSKKSEATDTLPFLTNLQVFMNNFVSGAAVSTYTFAVRHFDGSTVLIAGILSIAIIAIIGAAIYSMIRRNGQIVPDGQQTVVYHDVAWVLMSISALLVIGFGSIYMVMTNL